MVKDKMMAYKCPGINIFAIFVFIVTEIYG